jgi:uncharacterized protein YndB with AHSA1/START domain
MKIEVTATIETTLAKAWDAMIKPESIMKWNFATPDWHCPQSTVDFRIGGKMSSTMAAKDGSFSFDFSGTFTEIQEQVKFAYQLDDDRMVEIFFEEKEIVTEIFDAETQNPIEMQQMGWQAILNNYKSYCEQQN